MLKKKFVETQGELSKIFGVHIQTIRDWISQGAPRKTEKGWDVEAMRTWRAKNLKPAAGHAPRVNGNGHAPLAVRDPALDRFRAARARHFELDVAQRERELLSREEIHTLHIRLGDTLRSIGDSLQRHHGLEALRLYEEGLDEYARQVKEFFENCSRPNGTP